jgi:hypothetical protein
VLATTAPGAAQLLLGCSASNAPLGHWIALIAVGAVTRWPWSMVPPLPRCAGDEPGADLGLLPAGEEGSRGLGHASGDPVNETLVPSGIVR